MFLAMEVIGVRVEMPSNQPIVLLKEKDGLRFLPIWVGTGEATAIAFAQQGIQPPRPLTHDLMRDVIESLDAVLTTVHLTQIKDGIFYATLNLRTSTSQTISVSARPSDAIALAIRTHSNILAAPELLEEAGIEIPVANGDENQEVERFKEFLEQINPEDFKA